MAQQHDSLPETHNPFERDNINCDRNDAIDAGMGFVVSFGFFATMFIIATIIQYVNA
ncbi:MAG: YqzM family protein [Caryophanon sp.]|nr:YqzM family protein [Caryophanon sp.]